MKISIILIVLATILFIGCNDSSNNSNSSQDAPGIEWEKMYEIGMTNLGANVVPADDGGFTTSIEYFDYQSLLNCTILKTGSTGDSLWVTTIDGEMMCRDFRTTSDGGYVLVGLIYAGPGMPTDLKLIKFDINGLVVWQQTFQSPWGAVIGTSIIETIDGGYTIGVGTSTAGQSLSSELHSYLLKTDAGGDSLWSIFLENIAATAILETTSDCYAIAGVTDPEGSSDRALNLLQLDDSQAVQWSKSWDIGEYEFPSELLRTFDGGFAIGGSIMSNLEQQDLFLLETNSEGDLQWQRFYHDDDLNYIRGCFLMDDGGYALAGSSTPNDYSDTQALAIRTNSMGFELWRYRSDYGNIQVYDACTAPDDGIVFTGKNNGETWLMKLEGE